MLTWLLSYDVIMRLNTYIFLVTTSVHEWEQHQRLASLQPANRRQQRDSRLSIISENSRASFNGWESVRQSHVSAMDSLHDDDGASEQTIENVRELSTLDEVRSPW
jgi:hypothetical protein